MNEEKRQELREKGRLQKAKFRGCISEERRRKYKEKACARGNIYRACLRTKTLTAENDHPGCSCSVTVFRVR